MRPRTVFHLTFGMLFAMLLLFSQTAPVSAQPQPCDDLIDGLTNAFTPEFCQQLNLGRACYATDSVTTQMLPLSPPFSVPGDQTNLATIRRIEALGPDGAAVLVGGSPGHVVKVLVLGGSQLTPATGQPAKVFTLRNIDGEPVCEGTRSGMILQTPGGAVGSLVVNNAIIKLASTAYVVPGADLMFDQDPRDPAARRLANGTRNPNALFCSGFGSDCEFGDESCSSSDRMLWGPFCREDVYGYIRPGLYRVSLYGSGRVRAGATDYEASGRERFSMGAQELVLPASYTFCWTGLDSGGSGFETIVESRSDDARISHVTVELVGRSCSMDVPEDVTSPWPMTMMTIYNVQGNVEVRVGTNDVALETGQRMRIFYDDSRPIIQEVVSERADYVLSSDLVEWATNNEEEGAGLPEIEVEDSTPPVLPPPTPPDPETQAVVRLQATALNDGPTYAVTAQAVAYDPDIGRSNGDGIDSVAFELLDPEGRAVLSSVEADAPYCAFGEDDGECTRYDFYENGYRWPSGQSIIDGRYSMRATVTTLEGRSSLHRSEFTVRMDAYPPQIDEVTIDSCSGDGLVANAFVGDDRDMERVVFRYRLYDAETAPPSRFAAQTMSLQRSAGFYSVAVGDAYGRYVDYYVEATDSSGNRTTTSIVSRIFIACIE